MANRATVLRERTQSGVALADGAMGTELQRAGLPAGQPGERWNLEHPDRIEAIHRAYCAAGSQVVLTNTFGANPWVLGRYGLASALDGIILAAVALARRAAGPDVVVLGDIGPSGELLEPFGRATVKAFHEAFYHQASELLSAGADGIMVETMSAIEEAASAVSAARAAGAPLVVASMTFNRGKDGRFHTMMGTTPQHAMSALVEAGAEVVGANCGTKMSLDEFARLTAILRGSVDCPLIVKPNAGMPELVGGRAAYRMSAEEFADGMRGTVEAGARLIGGCCGTTPAHIAAASRMLRSLDNGGG
jgi:5-methyltetrahydrofolate--homocysteine methyltransferase